MASYRRPKGTVVRPIPDWNVQNLNFGGVQNGFSTAQNYYDGFTNLETDGGSLILWDATIALGRFTAATPVVGQANWFIAQVPVPGPTAPFAPLDPMSPGGTIRSVMAHTYDTSSLVSGLPFYTVLSGEEIWEWPHDWPLAIIRPGYSFLVHFTFTNAFAGLGVIVEKAAFP